MPFTILALVATGSIGVVAAPLVVTAAIGALGFGAGGIAAGSWAAGFMASYEGTVASGSACAVLKSVGSAGLFDRRNFACQRRRRVCWSCRRRDR
ncbi:hypothetical protein BGX29_012167 [Mortierella sp. GBA35]|nr:hypothetical protein BGX29_012167 [Mortierella sp. GBA35]